MDYSLIVGIHDCERAEQDVVYFATAENNTMEDNDSENGLEDDECFGPGGVPTPPDSPQPAPYMPFSGELDSEMERYGFKSSPGKMTLVQQHFYAPPCKWPEHIVSCHIHLLSAPL